MHENGTESIFRRSTKMVEIIFSNIFKKTFSKIKDHSIKEKILKQISKISENPEIGKPMKHNRKGTRELYVSSMRLSYSYDYNNKIFLLNIYHKDEQ